MDTINPHACREGFEQQRKVGINVDWFTWQIAWHDAMFTQVDSASPSTSGQELADEKVIALANEWLTERDGEKRDDYLAAQHWYGNRLDVLAFARSLLAMKDGK